MATSPTSQSTTVNNAAKDDVVGLNGSTTFTIKDLLANDPGSTSKLDLTKQFFFGDSATGDHSVQAQTAYLAKHGITVNSDGSFTIHENATDISYFVQIGNKGTWSQADVEVHAPEPPPSPPANHKPVAVADETSVKEDASVTGSVATNDSDADGNVLTFTVVGDAPAGLTFHNDGSYTFNASHANYQSLAEGEKLDVVAHYTVDDGHGGQAQSSLTIHLTGTNDAPKAVADVNSGFEDSIITGNVSANDSDLDHGATLSYSLNEPVAGLTVNSDGSYSFDAGNAAYQHLGKGVTTDVVATYTVTDEHGASSTSTLTVTLTGTNDAPVAVADVNSGLEDSIITGSVAANDSDIDLGATLSYSLNEPVAGLTINSDGSYSFDAGNAAYQHLGEGVTTDVAATYTVTDEHGASSTSTLTMTLTGTNDAPVAVADVNSGLEDTLINGNVATNDKDIDDGDVLTFALVGDAPAGLTFHNDGSYTFDASHADYQSLAQDEKLDVVAHYTVDDGHGGQAQSSLTIHLTGTNDAPKAVADVNAGLEDSIITGSVAANDSDIDHGATLSYSLNEPVAGLTINSDGSYSFDAGNAAYQHLGEGVTTDVAATYTVTDEHGASSTSTLTMTLTGTNDAPVAVADVNSGLEDTLINGNVATNDKDIDDGDVLTFALVGDAPAGLTFHNDGSYTFDASHADYQSLAQDEKLDVVAHYTVDDGHGGQAQSSLTIHLTGTNDAPKAVADVNAGLEDSIITGSVAANDSDIDHGATLSYSLNEPVAGLTINSDGSYSFDAGNAAYQHLGEGVTTDVVATYTVTDEHGASSTSTLTMTLTGTNDAPVAHAEANAGQEDSVILGNVSASDIDDGDALAYSLVGDGPAGLTFRSDGSYELDAHNAAYQDIHLGKTQDVKFDYMVSDGHGATDTATATITITGDADLYHGSVEPVTFTKTAVSSSGNGQPTAETFHFNMVLDEGADSFGFSNGAVTVTVQGDMDGKNENATVTDVASVDLDGAVFQFSGTVSNSQDKGAEDGFPHDNVSVVRELPMLANALADGHVDFDVALSGDVGNGTTIQASMKYDYWM